MRNIKTFTQIRIILSLLLLCGQGVIHTQAQERDSLDLMIGQMIMVGFKGMAIEDDTVLQKDIEQGFAGGVVLYEKNISPSNSWILLKQLTSSLQKLSDIPLWIAIDQEGGRVNRLKTKYGFPPSVSAAYLGKTDNSDTTFFYAELTASTLAGLGINLNFTPVVDLATNPDNPVIAGVERSFSSDPEIVTRMAKDVILAHRKFGIATSLKHFPGHGSSTSDTHLGMADVSETWDPIELLPYKNLIGSGMADAIMTAHIINKNLDPDELPSTLSKRTLTVILRDSLNFRGVIFSDDMHMHAIGKYFGTKEAVLKAIDAGVDVLVFSNNISDGKTSTIREIHGYIRHLVEEGVIPMDRIRQSYNRILDLKFKYYHSYSK